MHSILVTGRPGVGKSTLIKGLLEALPERVRVAGMASGEIRIDGKRQGFTVRALGGDSGLLASPELTGGPRFGSVMPDGERRLGISLAHLEQVVCPEIQRTAKKAHLVVIDEIGTIQAESAVFRCLVDELMTGSLPMLCTISLESHEWISGVRHDARFAVLELAPNNRQLMGSMLRCYLREQFAHE